MQMLYPQLTMLYQSKTKSLFIFRYNRTEKKKYNLGAASSNLEKLKADQLHELNALLVKMKSEHDNLMKEIFFKKQETEIFGVT